MTDQEPPLPPDWLLDAVRLQEMELRMMTVAGSLTPLLVAKAHLEATAGRGLLAAMQRVYDGYVDDLRRGLV
jgi:hypothetical protein